jgi:hypothetical protein
MQQIKMTSRIQCRTCSSSSFSPGLAPLDFCSFGAVKGNLSASEFGITGELASEEADVRSFISHVNLTSVFRDWEHRLLK